MSKVISYNRFYRTRVKGRKKLKDTKYDYETLRKLPTGYVYSRKELQEAVDKYNLSVPVDNLIYYGNRCNWLTHKGVSFSDVEWFAKGYEKVYLKAKKKFGERI